MSKEYHDRFSEATEELQNKSAFFCESCNKKYDHKEAKEKGNTCCGRTMKELVEESFGP
jgi:transcription initiation factor IIE alpha subunit